MVKFLFIYSESLSWIAIILLALSLLIGHTESKAARTSSNCNNRVLTFPRVIDMDDYAARNEIYDLDLDWAEINPGFSDDHGYISYDAEAMLCDSNAFMTRTLGGSIPGPTLTVSPGTTMKINFRNKLTYQTESESSRFVVQGSKGQYLYTTELDLSRLGKYNDPDIANLHFHGLHISNTLPSDDTTLAVLPQNDYLYVIHIPEYHQPGLHWIHSHHRGSSALHLVGGAAMALIVKDPNEDTASVSDNFFSNFRLPIEVRAATERLMVIQDWDIPEALLTARQAGDKLLNASFSEIRGGESVGQRFVTVNGKFQAIATIPVGKWERWRFLYAGWQDLPLEFGITLDGNQADCEFFLLAKDGIYISDYPRGPMLSNSKGYTTLPIPPGGRADFMVRCHNVGETTRFEALHRRNFLMVNVVDEDNDNEDISSLNSDERIDDDDNNNLNNSNLTSTSASTVSSSSSSTATLLERSITPLTPWTITNSDLPPYLQSVKDLEVSDGCSCQTKFDGYDDSSRINGHIYRPGNMFMHTSYLGSVVERKLLGVEEHSYHQHVYPYQIIDYPNHPGDESEGNEYFKVGDWHDTYMDKKQKGGGPITIRYRPSDIPGKVIVHCHNAMHADTGIIQKEYVRDATEGSVPCQCDIFGPISGMGIIDDVEVERIVGGVSPDVVPSSSSSSSSNNNTSGRRLFASSLFLRTMLVPLLVTAATLLSAGTALLSF